MLSRSPLKETPLLRIRADRRFPDRPLKFLWEARELIVLLARRDVSLRYQHSIAGFGWALLQPLLTILVLAAFRMLMGQPTSLGMPYPLYAGTVLVPWTFFVHSMNQSSHCLLKHTSVMTKVRFPRLALPLAAVIGAAADFVAALALVPLLMIYYHVPPRVTLLALPIFALHLVTLATAIGIWLSLLNARLRDTANALPFITQLWFFLSPIVYTSEMLPAKWRLAAGLNPVEGILEGFRWSIFDSASPMLPAWLGLSGLITAGLLLSGIIAFLAGEETLTDVI
ncbi:MAG TPA: ABC transporter permease [Bryobacteraceae bacterium]